MVSHTVNSQIPADLDKEPRVVKYDTTRTTTVQHRYILKHCTVWPIEQVKVQNFPKIQFIKGIRYVLPHDEFSQEQIQQYLIF